MHGLGVLVFFGLTALFFLYHKLNSMGFFGGEADNSNNSVQADVAKTDTPSSEEK